MAKYYDDIGFVITSESLTEPSVYETTVTKVKVFGEVLKYEVRTENPGKVNDDVNINNQISIIATPYIIANLGNLAFVKFMGNYWKVKSYTVNHPRILIYLGGLYDGNTN